MGLFKKKKKLAKAPSPEETTARQAVDSVFDEAYRNELRNLGRKYFGQIIADDKEALRREFTRTFTETSNDLRGYIRRQLSIVVDHVRKELSDQLESQLSEHRRVLNDAQEDAVQSITRSTQELHERYGQLSRTLERTVADQEAKMTAVFSENERQLNEMQVRQAETLATLTSSTKLAEERAATFQQSLDNLRTNYEAQVNQLIQRSQLGLDEAGQKQKAAIDSVTASAEALKAQAAGAEATINQAVARQQEALIGAFENNLAQVIEHYLLSALGDQFTVKDQLPAIVSHLEENKAALVEDAKL